MVVAAVWVRVQLLETEKKATLRETYDFWKGPEAAAVLHRCAPTRTPAANTRQRRGHASGEHTPARRTHASGEPTDPGSCAFAFRRTPLAVLPCGGRPAVVSCAGRQRQGEHRRRAGRPAPN